MRQFILLFRSELRRIWRDKTYFALLLILPTLSLLFFVCYFSGSGIRELPIAVVDNSKSNLSNKLVEMIDATASSKVCYTASNNKEALSLIRRGRVYAAVIIPHSFEADIVSGVTTKVALYNSGANISTNGFIAKDIQSVVTTFGAGIELQRGATLAEVMPIKFNKHILFNPYLNYAYYIAPCFMSMMTMIFTLLATVYAVAERRCNSATELMSRVAPTTLIMSIFSLITLLVLFRILGVPLVGSKWVIVFSTLLFIVVYQAIAILFVGITKSRHLSLSLGGGYSVLAFTFSGLTFPTMAMFPPLKWASYLFPFTYYMDVLVDQTLRGSSSINTIESIGYMSLFLLLPLLIRKRLC